MANNKKKKIVTYMTIVLYIIAILIYEIGICNGEKMLKGQDIPYHFSLCRIILYIIFMIGLIINIHKFVDNAIDTFQGKNKRVVILAYCIVASMLMIYVAIRWTSMYQILSLFIAMLMGTIFLIYVSSDYIKNVIVITFTLGIVFTFSTDFHHTLDEKKHIMTSINIASGNLDYVNEPLNNPLFNDIIFNCDMDSFAKMYGQKYEQKLTQEWNRTEETEIYYICSIPAEYNFILYLPSSIGILYTKLLGGSIADAYIIGRLFNLIVYSFMVVIMLKILPYKKKIFFAVYMLPLVLLLAGSFSTDGIAFGLLGLFIAYCLKLSEKEDKEIGIKQIVTLMILFIGCLLVKDFAYFAMIFLVLVLPIIKILKNNKKKIPILILLILISVSIVFFLAMNKLNKVTQIGGDIRGGDTGVTGQLNFLMQSPKNIIEVGISHVCNSILNYNWYTYLNHPDFFGKYASQMFFVEMIFIIYIAITDNSKKIKKRTIMVSSITALLVFATTSLMLYLTFTPIGQINITGYQPRYIIPLVPLVLMLINHKRYIGKTTEEEEKRIDTNISIVTGLIIMVNVMLLIHIV